MNKLSARVEKIDKTDNLHVITCKLGCQTIKVVSLELQESLQIGSSVELSVKSTNISLAKNLTGELSIVNQLTAKVTAIDKGSLLCAVQVELEGFSLECLLTVEATLSMGLSVGDDVTVLVKGSEVFVCGRNISF